jgi:hypothetical protein
MLGNFVKATISNNRFGILEAGVRIFRKSIYLLEIITEIVLIFNLMLI